MRGLQLVVADAVAARQELTDRGVEAMTSCSSRRTTAAPSSGFADPDGNTLAVQEPAVRGDKPPIPPEHRSRFGEGRASRLSAAN